jgi:hypothetical protein
MSKQIKILLVLIVAAAAVYFLVVRKPWKSYTGNGTDFAIADTLNITKIFLADPRGGKVLLTKQVDGSWLVDNHVAADKTKINLLLQTIHDIKMRNPLSTNEFNTVIKELTAAGIKVEFYEGNDLLKTIYVGQMTLDQSGTFMMIDGAESPFVTHIPGFVGYLTPRFPTNPVKWKSKLIFDTKFDELAKVTIDYILTPSESFSLDNIAATPVLKDAAGNAVQTDANFLKYYAGSFTQLFAEAYDDNFTAAQHDSIFQGDAFCTIKVENKAGKTQALKLHIKGIDKKTKSRYNDEGKELTYDTDKYFAFVNGDKNMVYIQNYSFGRVLKKLSDFKSVK